MIIMIILKMCTYNSRTITIRGRVPSFNLFACIEYFRSRSSRVECDQYLTIGDADST